MRNSLDQLHQGIYSTLPLLVTAVYKAWNGIIAYSKYSDIPSINKLLELSASSSQSQAKKTMLVKFIRSRLASF